jgi:hypothetical protein
VEFIVLYGKHPCVKLLPGVLVGLFENGARIRCKYDLEISTNIKLKLLTDTAVLTEEPDVYAKVIKKFAAQENDFSLRFTGIPPKRLKRLRKVRQSLA